MKKQFALVLALSSMLMTACVSETDPDPQPRARKPFVDAENAKMIITSIFPDSAIWGQSVTIFGENFGATISDNYVTFDGAYAEIIEVQRGIIVVRVPLNLRQGHYSLNVSSHGQSAISANTCEVTGK